MKFNTTNIPTTINLDYKFHGGFSIISYAVEYSNLLGYTDQEKYKIVNDMVQCISFDQILNIFTHHFGTHATIIYRGKEIK